MTSRASTPRFGDRFSRTAEECKGCFGGDPTATLAGEVRGVPPSVRPRRACSEPAEPSARVRAGVLPGVDRGVMGGTFFADFARERVEDETTVAVSEFLAAASDLVTSDLARSDLASSERTSSVSAMVAVGPTVESLSSWVVACSHGCRASGSSSSS